MEAKVLITVSGGVITSFNTNLPDCKVLIVDYDLQDDGVEPVREIEEQDEMFEDGKSYLLFEGSNPSEQEVADELKRLKY
ncbi:hypothetical protein HDF24_04490 [Mucilaginibacter sp. X4EP1]|uniref:hypothetical protein n=1 Tax=Mucilaginibacter sp. X4EP1 TaxID=2723092 RepID=UPI002167144D|nr:hypothetical protein [Mucilaginibacter sp. X4EP1]MCS3816248.1 hypothetical protein [Mucilaginibacter sp. X4EP1]